MSSGAPKLNPFIISLGLGLGFCVQPTEEAIVSTPTTWTLPGTTGEAILQLPEGSLSLGVSSASMKLESSFLIGHRHIKNTGTLDKG